MKVELVGVRTSDDVELDGGFLEPTRPAQPSDSAIDAFVIVHGSGGNFYRSGLERASRLRDAGYAVAVVNTRGHDVVASHTQEAFIGNAYDVWDDCRYDLDATIGLVAERGYSKICILGISIGATKVVYYQAKVHDPRVAGVIAFGPVNTSHKWFSASEEGEEHEKICRTAKELVDAGQPDALMQVDFPNQHAVFSAAVYLDRHGPGERYHLLPVVNDVECPLFILAGTEENLIRHRGFAQAMFDEAAGNPNVVLKLVQDATHGFSGMDDEFVDSVLEWAKDLKPVGVGTR